MEEDGIESNFPAEFRTRETADLFLVLVMELLKDGGRAAVVLPDGTLFGEGIKTRIKTKLLDECNLHTIVRLPNGVFAPYTSIKTNILFFTKGEPTKEVWFYEHPYPDGYKSYSKTKPMRIEEFEPEKAWWTDREESERAWRVSVDDIAASGYNLDIKNPNTVDEGHEDPDVLLARYAEAVEQVRASTGGAEGEPRRVTRRPLMDAQTFLDNFGTIADAPGGIDRLRELVLDLAVRGRLVRHGNRRRLAAHSTGWTAARHLSPRRRVRTRRVPNGADALALPSVPRLLGHGTSRAACTLARRDPTRAIRHRRRRPDPQPRPRRVRTTLSRGHRALEVGRPPPPPG